MWVSRNVSTAAAFSAHHLHTSFVLTSLVIASFVLAAAEARAQSAEIVTFPSADGARITAHLIRAIGNEPKSPTVIALHGCGGPLNRDKDRLSSRHRSWGRLLAHAGYNVLFPDSFGSRGHGALCTVKPRPVRQKDRIADVAGALAWLQAREFVDPRAISVLGWSNGGSTALGVSRAPYARGLKHVIAFYPGCTAVLKRAEPKPLARLKIIMGAADDWTAPAPCQALAKLWAIPIVLYPGAHHGFDSPDSRLRQRTGLAFTTGGGAIAHVGTHPEARRRAIAETLATLAAD